MAFYLDPAREHNLSDLVLKSLLSCNGHNLQLSNVTVEREVPSDYGRIDLVIESDSHVIAVENKIFHTPENPFEDYQNKVRKISGDREKVFLLLGLREEDHPELGEFVSITYSELFSNLKNNIGNYIQDGNNKYIVFLLEFITSIENIISGSSMNKEIIYFFSKNKTECIEFINSFNQVVNELRSKVDYVKNNVKFESSKIVRNDLFRESKKSLEDCVFYDIELDGQIIAVDCYIEPKGWEITIFPRKDSYENKEKLKESLMQRDISFEDGERLKYGDNYSYDYPIEEIVSVVEELLHVSTRT